MTFSDAERAMGHTIRGGNQSPLTGIVVGLCALAAACTTSPAPSPDAARVVIRTQPSPGPNEICMDARGGGTLVTDPISGLGVTDTTGRRTHVFWPFGYSARLDGDRIALLDRQGQLIARVGDVIGMMGGLGGADDEWIACQFEPVIVLATPSG